MRESCLRRGYNVGLSDHCTNQRGASSWGTNSVGPTVFWRFVRSRLRAFYVAMRPTSRATTPGP